MTHHHFHNIIVSIFTEKRFSRYGKENISRWEDFISYWMGRKQFFLNTWFLVSVSHKIWRIRYESYLPKYGLPMYLFLMQLSKTKNILALFFKFKTFLKMNPPQSTATNHWHATIFMSHKLWIIAKLVRQPSQPISVNSK